MKPQRPRGRPPIDDDDPSVDVHLRLPSKQYDDAWRRAQRAGVSVPEVIRRQLRATDPRRILDDE